MALIRVNIWYLKCFFYPAASCQSEEAFLPLSTSTLIPTDVENTVKNKKVDAFLLAPLFKLARPELKGRRGLNSVARAASEAFRRSKTTVYRWISNICSALSRCPLRPSFCRPGAVILKPGVTAIHLLWSAAVRGTGTVKLPFLHLHCVQFPPCVASADEWQNWLLSTLGLVFPSVHEHPPILSFDQSTRAKLHGENFRACRTVCPLLPTPSCSVFNSDCISLHSNRASSPLQISTVSLLALAGALHLKVLQRRGTEEHRHTSTTY